MTDLLPESVTRGVFLRRDAIAAGMNDRQIAAAVRSRDWHRLRQGAYVAGPVFRDLSPTDRHTLVSRAVLLQSRTGVVLSHLSALPEYGAPVWNLPLDVVHVTRLDQRAGRKEAGVRQHQGQLEPSDMVERNGVCVTSPTRTAIDITTVADIESALVAVNYLLHAGLTTLGDMRSRYTSMNHHPYTLRTDLVFRLADGRIESIGETRTFFLCWRQGVPAPSPQHVIHDARGREVARLDFAWPELGVWLEFDGKEKYVKQVAEGEDIVDVVVREKQRESMIAELTGWRCVRITWADLYYPERTAARIMAALSARRPIPSRPR